MNKKILIPVFCFFLLLTVFSVHIPFFWDGTFFSALSLNYYQFGFHGFTAPASHDTGGFPLFPAYLTILWKWFGSPLVTSHFGMLPFLMGIAWEYFKFAKRWLSGATLLFSMILLVIEPVFLTQSILMGYDIIVTYFFLLALNALMDKRKTLFSIALILLCLISVRGIMLGAALFVIDTALNRKNGYSFIKNYIAAAAVLLFWILYHHAQTGWYIFSPERAENAEAFNGPGMIFRQILYIVWKNTDLGHITLWLTLLVGYHYFLKHSDKGKALLKIILIPLLTLTLFMCLINNPISPKYFMTVFLLLNVGACAVIFHIEKSNMQKLIFLSVCISLICGNFILYPQRYGNSWDASLKVLPYFSAKEEMDKSIVQSGIAPEQIATQFPLTEKQNYISPQLYEARSYTDLDNLPVDNFRYFLYSNVINTNRIDDLEEIQKTWTKMIAVKKGQVIMILFRNPVLWRNFGNDLSSTDQGRAGRLLPGMAMP